MNNMQQILYYSNNLSNSGHKFNYNKNNKLYSLRKIDRRSFNYNKIYSLRKKSDLNICEQYYMCVKYKIFKYYVFT